MLKLCIITIFLLFIIPSFFFGLKQIFLLINFSISNKKRYKFFDKNEYPFGMQMPGRKYSSTTQYRYGFNGKEEDDEVKGDGNQQDYGMRIYDPRLGRFLSVDPITKEFPALTPYQYATNNPIEGNDLDGLEYVSSKRTRLDFYNGVLTIKLENLNSVVRNILTDYNNKPENWAYHSIGADFRIGTLNFGTIIPRESGASDADPSDANPNNRSYVTKVGKPIAQSTGLPDRRYKDREVTTATPGGARGIALLSIAIDLTAQGLIYYIKSNFKDEEKLISQQLVMFRSAAADVNYALKNTPIIPKEYQSEVYLSDITNVVFCGISNIMNSDKKTGADMLRIGMEIYNTLSRKRDQFSGTVNLDMLSGQSKTLPKPNPNYDPQYVNQNPPIENE